MLKQQEQVFKDMFTKLYFKLLDDVITNNTLSPIYKHHINFINKWRVYYKGDDYSLTEPNRIVTDYIASMTDDYFVDLFILFFPDDKKIEYISYFN